LTHLISIAVVPPCIYICRNSHLIACHDHDHLAFIISDYTDDPSSNLFPGDVNMDKLRGMYLTRRLRTVEEDGTVVERTELMVRR